ncbi:MAG: gluconate 2-dehydrogenase subunit 3 family protein [Acidobacteria bacterium]|nr:gluconate 2-dehydrogenase subunit 3 family protein [Acidobacteriota bacterium]
MPTIKALPGYQQPSELETPAHALLRAIADEIIPAGEGMPAASEVGSVDYIERVAARTQELKRTVDQGLAVIEELSHRKFTRTFLELASAERIAVLKELEAEVEPGLFRNLRDLVYESYYTQPRIWKLLSYESHPTNRPGPQLKPLDESLLDPVRQRPRLYREA